mmetsp:Transcript_28068/g.96613  ORF Transcript_28068/g.96613 Transcript_28068/m.96613 type:complete len:265 (+) Transcript_28068:133-927(+)
MRHLVAFQDAKGRPGLALRSDLSGPGLAHAAHGAASSAAHGASSRAASARLDASGAAAWRLPSLEAACFRPGYRNGAGLASAAHHHSGHGVAQLTTTGRATGAETGRAQTAPACPLEARPITAAVFVAAEDFAAIESTRRRERAERLLRQAKADLLRARRSEAPYALLLERLVDGLRHMLLDGLRHSPESAAVDAQLLETHRVLALVRRQLGQRGAVGGLAQLVAAQTAAPRRKSRGVQKASVWLPGGARSHRGESVASKYIIN